MNFKNFSLVVIGLLVRLVIYLLSIVYGNMRYREIIIDEPTAGTEWCNLIMPYLKLTGVISMFRFLAALGLVIGVAFSPVKASTEAFGITLGETTLEQLGKKFPSLKKESLQGDMIRYAIDKEDLNYDKIKGPLRVFIEPPTGKVVVIYAFLNKGMEGFEETNSVLARKYTKKKLINPFVGDKYARYVNGSDVIELNAPHMDFEMSLIYLTKARYDIMQENRAAAKKEKAAQDNAL